MCLSFVSVWAPSPPSNRIGTLDFVPLPFALLAVMESSGSSSVGSYSDGVYDKVESQSQAAAATNKPLPQVKPPVLPAVMLACLILLFTTCFVGILLSGLHFGHRVASGDCLGQSWVMFSVRTLFTLLSHLFPLLHYRPSPATK